MLRLNDLQRGFHTCEALLFSPDALLLAAKQGRAHLLRVLTLFPVVSSGSQCLFRMLYCKPAEGAWLAVPGAYHLVHCARMLDAWCYSVQLAYSASAAVGVQLRLHG